MTDDKLITEEQLHEAASLAAMMKNFEDSGLKNGAVEDFIALSEFHPPMDAMSMAYGILIGVLATKVRDERNDGNGTVRPVRNDPGGT